MDPDPELEAIRARLRQELAGAAAAPAAPADGARPALDRPVETDDAGLPDLVREHPFLVVDVWAPWCGPCRILGPTIDKLAEEMAGDVVFAKLNADHNPRTMQTFGIQGIPTLLAFKDGKLVDRIVGVPPTPALRARLATLSGSAGRRGGAGGAMPGPRR